MSKQERKRRLIQARSSLAKSAFELSQMKEHSTPSEWKQVAEIIVEIGKIRDKLLRVEE